MEIRMKKSKTASTGSTAAKKPQVRFGIDAIALNPKALSGWLSYVARQLQLPRKLVSLLATSHGLTHLAKFQLVQVYLEKEVVAALDKELGGARDQFIQTAIKDKICGLIKAHREEGL
jgi:hypothetical protein